MVANFKVVYMKCKNLAQESKCTLYKYKLSQQLINSAVNKICIQQTNKKSKTSVTVVKQTAVIVKFL